MKSWIEAAKKIRDVMDLAGKMLTDEQALTVPGLYKTWNPTDEYSVSDRRLYNGILYRCLIAHTGQETWNPEDATSIWTKVLISETNEILPWEQPDSTNTYSKGSKVTHNGKTWISDIDNNSWEPGVYGWSEVE